MLPEMSPFTKVLALLVEAMAFPCDFRGSSATSFWYWSFVRVKLSPLFSRRITVLFEANVLGMSCVTAEGAKGRVSVVVALTTGEPGDSPIYRLCCIDKA